VAALRWPSGVCRGRACFPLVLLKMAIRRARTAPRSSSRRPGGEQSRLRQSASRRCQNGRKETRGATSTFACGHGVAFGRSEDSHPTARAERRARRAGCERLAKEEQSRVVAGRCHYHERQLKQWQTGQSSRSGASETRNEPPTSSGASTAQGGSIRTAITVGAPTNAASCGTHV
jgi:hypothetical protein